MSFSILSTFLVRFVVLCQFFFFFFNDTATTEIYTLSLHDALPILPAHRIEPSSSRAQRTGRCSCWQDRKSTRLNSSHPSISYAVFCLKKKTQIDLTPPLLSQKKQTPEDPRAEVVIFASFASMSCFVISDSFMPILYFYVFFF